MKNKKLILSILLVSIIIGCVGCGTDKPHLDPGTSPTGPTGIGGDSNDAGHPSEFSSEIIRDDSNIWEKEQIQISKNTIKLNQSWDQFIEVDGAKIYSSKYTDLSVVKNYYYTSNDSYAAAETAYYLPTFMLQMKSPNTQIDKYSYADMWIMCTTLAGDEAKHDVVVDEVRFMCMTNPYEVGFDEITRSAYSTNNEFGVGSNYKYVVSVIGDATEKSETEMSEGLKITTCVYNGKNTSMLLTFMWFADDGIDSAVLTSVNWIATTARTNLQSQPTIAMFEGYGDAILKTENDQSEEIRNDDDISSESIPTDPNSSETISNNEAK